MSTEGTLIETISVMKTMEWYRIETTIFYEDEVASHFAILEINDRIYDNNNKSEIMEE